MVRTLELSCVSRSCWHVRSISTVYLPCKEIALSPYYSSLSSLRRHDDGSQQIGGHAHWLGGLS